MGDGEAVTVTVTAGTGRAGTVTVTAGAGRGGTGRIVTATMRTCGWPATVRARGEEVTFTVTMRSRQWVSTRT